MGGREHSSMALGYELWAPFPFARGISDGHRQPLLSSLPMLLLGVDASLVPLLWALGRPRVYLLVEETHGPLSVILKHEKL